MGSASGGSVKLVLQALRMTGEFSNARIAAGLKVPVVNEQEAQQIFPRIRQAVQRELEHRLHQWLKAPKPKYDRNKAKTPVPETTEVFAAVSLLVPTEPYENVRVDGEVSFFVGKASLEGAYDRAFALVSEQVNQAMAELKGGAAQRGTTREGGKARNFDW